MNHRSLCIGLALAAAALPAAGRDLSPQVERLANGLTVMVLEDHAQPLVSTQVLYRAGGRTEAPGATGLAHFVEHMAFRATENFPETQVVSRIYGAGGEWHGYTWIDQTTYFETLPADRLDLALAIEADRMARLMISDSPAGEIEAERGAVLNELHGYENDPASRLYDAVIAASFSEHPYRNNVIGWESDVRALTRDEIAAFYHRFYAPANAVLAVVGDVDGAKVMELVHKNFDALPAGERAPLPRSPEPPQLGERRVELHGGGRDRFQIAWRAPAASDPDYPAFLLLQAVLSGSPGADFHQDGDPFPARPGSRLHGLPGVESLRTFFAPTAQPYVFSLSGTAVPAATPARIEGEIEKRIAALRERPVPAGELEAARRQLQDALVLDDETTEDAAHQMAFFEGIGAFETLRRLPELVAAVTPEDLRRVATSRLQPWQRTIGWMRSGPPPAAPATPVATSPQPALRSVERGVPGEPEAVDRFPLIKKLGNGVGLIALRLPHVPAGVLRVVVPADAVSFADAGLEVAPDEPSWRHTSLAVPFRAGELASAIERARRALASAKPEPPDDPAAADDPEALLRLTLRDLLGAGLTPPSPGPLTPVVVVAVGDLDEAEAIRLMENAFGKLPSPRPLAAMTLEVKKSAETVALPGRAQAELGYAVPAAAPSAPEADAWRILLYTISHGYEGRLGKELIARLGLLYYIDSRYDSDGRSAWISLVTGVDPDKLAAARARFADLLGHLRDEPPTDLEIDEAKQHLIGRRTTATMSNEEVSAAFAREWIEQGRLLPDDEFARRVRAVTRGQVLALVPRFLAGATAVVGVAGRP
jgi:predicted Zn-dependent peptidase